MFTRTAEAFAEHPALRSADGSVELSWADYAARTERIALGLLGLGVGVQDGVASLLTNRVEFHLIDVAALRIGALPFSIYPTSSPDQITHQITNSGARVLFTERALLPALSAATLDLDALVVVDGGTDLLSLAELERNALAGDLDALTSAVRPEHVACLIYTSGTTGPAKGVELTHTNLISAIRGLNTAFGLRALGRTVSYLPHAHLADRMSAHYTALAAGTCLTCVSDPRVVLGAVAQIKPTHFLGVPRIWEKLHAALIARFAAEPDHTIRADISTAFGAALRKVRAEQAGGQVDAELTARVEAYDRTVFAPIRAQLGFDQLDFAYTGAAPIPVEVHEFFLALGVRVCEVWGMSETSVTGTLCRPDAIRVGTVGTAAPGIELRLAADGELHVRGPQVMRGYRNMPERTEEVLSPDGWLATGDIARMDADGFVTIVDRKKEIIINSAGKNMSPANIEARLKSSSPLIGQACCIGDGRPYNVALLVLDPDGCRAYAADHLLIDASPAALATVPELHARVSEAVEQANSQLSRVEQIKKFTILPTEWQAGSTELTPTMKLRRTPIAEKYSAEITALYQ